MKTIVIAILAALLMGTPSMAQKKGKVNSLDVSFNYQKQPGAGSNQYAIWIENEKGESPLTHRKDVLGVERRLNEAILSDPHVCQHG